jgi:hypothetical protein
MTGRVNHPRTFMAAGWRQHGADSAVAARLPKNAPKPRGLAIKKTQPAHCDAEQTSKVWNYDRFDDNGLT